MRKPNYSPTYQESSSSRRTWLHLTLDEGFQISHLHQACILLFILLPVVVFIGKKEGLLCRNFPSFVATILYFYLTCICLGKLVSFFFFSSFFPWPNLFLQKGRKKPLALSQNYPENGWTLGAVWGCCSSEAETEVKKWWGMTPLNFSGFCTFLCLPSCWTVLGMGLSSGVSKTSLAIPDVIKHLLKGV